MRHNFALSRSQIVTLVSGLAFLGLVIFAGGLLSGVYWQLRDNESRVEAITADPVSPPEPVPEPASVEPRKTLEPADEEIEPVPPEPVPPEPVRAKPVREKPVHARPARPEARPDSGRRVYELQLELFRVEANATRLVDELRGQGYEPFIVEVLSSAGAPRYTVRIGAYRSLAEAEAAQAELEARGNQETVIRYRDASEP